MISKQQALEYIEKVRKSRPLQIVDKVAEKEKGIWFALIYLDKNDGEGYANAIADEMNISRARASVLVEKLVSRGYVEKCPSKKDGRIAILKITKEGKQAIEIMRDNIAQKVVEIVDIVGKEDFDKFIDVSLKIEAILKGKCKRIKDEEK